MLPVLPALPLCVLEQETVELKLVFRQQDNKFVKASRMRFRAVSYCVGDRSGRACVAGAEIVGRQTRTLWKKRKKQIGCTTDSTRRQRVEARRNCCVLHTAVTGSKTDGNYVWQHGGVANEKITQERT